MKKMILLMLVYVLAMVCWGDCADDNEIRLPDMDKARRITGYYDPKGPIAEIQVKKWDPVSEESRKYIRFMNASPSRIFVNKACCEIPKEISSLQDLEDIVFDMHFELACMRRVKLADGTDMEQLEDWIKKVNTMHYLFVRSRKSDDGIYLHVCYASDARIFAVFRNPSLRIKLSNNERELLQVCCQWICDNIQEDMPNLLKIKKVHDALVDNSRYTCGYYDTYNIVVKGRGVCAAYTSATQLLLHMLKVDCRSVRGTEKMNHIWNIIDVNGEWYHTDVTWDDPICRPRKDVKRFYYFLISEAEMAVDHEWEDSENYPKTPRINKLGLFKRHDHREIKGGVNENDQEEYPRERESIFNSIAEMRRQEIEAQGDKLQPIFKPFTETVAPVADTANKTARQTLPLVKKKKEKKNKLEYKPVNTLQDLYDNLEMCVTHLDGPTVTFELANTCSCFIRTLLMADYHLYVKYWNFLPDAEHNKLTLDIEHWPHARILRAYEDEKLVSAKLTPEERKCLAECKSLAQKYGTVWKTDRQKIGDVYEFLVRDINWAGGESSLVKAVEKRESGSLGFAEAMHVVLTMMNFKSQLIPGRTDKSVHAWLVVQRNNKKWYHLDLALDAEKQNRNKSKFKYMLKCDDDVFDDHVWDMKEVPPTPIRDREKAAKQGLIRKGPEFPDLRKNLPLEVPGAMIPS